MTELAQGLVLWLSFDDRMGAATARDDSGQANTVRLQGLDAGSAWIAGRRGGAIHLATPAGMAMGYLRAESSPSLNLIGSDLAIAVWLWRAGGSGVVVSRRATAAGGSLYRLEVTDGDQLRLVINDRRGVRLNLLVEGRLPVGQWFHVAITADEKEARVYRDGLRVASAPYGVPIANDVSPLLIGATEGPSGAPSGLFAGSLDELLIYHRPLSDPEIAALAAGALPPRAAGE